MMFLAFCLMLVVSNTLLGYAMKEDSKHDESRKREKKSERKVNLTPIIWIYKDKKKKLDFQCKIGN